LAYRDESSPDFWSKVQKEELPHCGLCDPVTRHIEGDDGRVARCPRCWPPFASKPGAPNAASMLPQYWRCPVCRALTYRTESGLPCGVHRTVTAWRRDYDAAQSGQAPLFANPVTEAGARSARAQMADRPRPDPEPAEPAEEAEPADEYPF